MLKKLRKRFSSQDSDPHKIQRSEHMQMPSKYSHTSFDSMDRDSHIAGKENRLVNPFQISHEAAPMVSSDANRSNVGNGNFNITLIGQQPGVRYDFRVSNLFTYHTYSNGWYFANAIYCISQYCCEFSKLLQKY